MQKRSFFKNGILPIVLLMALASGAVFAEVEQLQSDVSGTPDEICDAATPAEEPATRDFDQPESVLADDVDYRAIFCTDAGAVYIDLFESATPLTVNNFVFLAENGYYNNTTFHRVIQDFMVQGGDPTASGSGGPNYRFEDEFVGFLHFDREGLLAMANAGANTNGSQFFITTSIPSYLNYRHTIFGEVLSGQENVLNVNLRDPQVDSEPGTALNTVVIITNPADVEADFEIPARPTQADAEAILTALPELAPGLVVDSDVTGVFDLTDFVSTFYANSSEETTGLLEDNGFEFAASIAHQNAECALDQIPFTEIDYQVLTFDSGSSAESVMADEGITNLVTVNGDMEALDSEALPNGYFIESTSACDTNVVHAVTYWQIGRNITIAGIYLPESEAPNADLWLDQVVGRQIYGNSLSELLRPELWFND
ncbi:MAG: peptidylprolyl isomerase [Aggregatilineales bacterium]